MIPHDGGAPVVQLAGVALAAPGTFTGQFVRRASGASFADVNSAVFGEWYSGTSFSAPLVAAGLGALRQAMGQVPGTDVSSGRIMMANALLLGDGWDGLSGTIRDQGMSKGTGAGRFVARWPSVDDLVAPFRWQWRPFSVAQGQHVYYPIVPGGGPLPATVQDFRWAAHITPNNTAETQYFDFWLEDTCPSSGPSPAIIKSDLSGDLRWRFHMPGTSAAGRCLRIHAYGRYAPVATTVYAAEYYHSGEALDPAPTTLNLTGWWRANYGGPRRDWLGMKSLGPSLQRPLIAGATQVPSVGTVIGNMFHPARFDGVDDRLTTTVNTTALLGSSAWTMVALVSPELASAAASSPTAEPAILSCSSGSAGLSFSTSGVTAFHSTGSGVSKVTVAAGVGSWQLLQARYNGAAIQLRINGGAWSSVAAPAAALAGASMRLGLNASGSLAFKGSIAELMTSPDALSDSQLNAVRAYASIRYGLAL